MKKRLVAIMAISMLCGSLLACDKKEEKPAPTTAQIITAEEEDSSSESAITIQKEEEPVVEESTEPEEDPIDLIYADAIDKLCKDKILPDGTEVFLEPGFGELSDNNFAVYDVDEDGVKELIVIWATAPNAGCIEEVLQYDEASKSYIVEVSSYPGLSFYSGGLALDPWSHNQGLGEDWPYSILQYNKDTKVYDYVGQVESWSKSYSDVDFDGNAYPDDVDKDGDGIVYDITYGDDYKGGFVYSKADYEAFYDKLIGSKEEYDIKYHSLSEENADKLREGTLDPKITGKLVKPMPSNVKIENIQDGIYNISLEAEDFWNDAGDYMAVMGIYTQEVYDIVDMNTLEVGDGIEVDGEVTRIDSLDRDGSVILINGGLDVGGLEFIARDESNCYTFFGFDDICTYKGFGETLVEFSKDCVIRDSSDLENPGEKVYDVEEFYNKVQGDSSIYMNQYNTTARIENGKVVEVIIVFVP